MHTIEFDTSMCKCLLVYGLIHSSLPYKQQTDLYTNKRSSIKATLNSKSRAIEPQQNVECLQHVLSPRELFYPVATDLLILCHKIDYVTSLNVDFRRLYITRHRDLGTSYNVTITRIVCCLPTVGSNKCVSIINVFYQRKYLSLFYVGETQ